MLGKITSAFSSLGPSRAATPPPPTHDSAARSQAYAHLATDLQQAGVPVSLADCAACDHPCDDLDKTAGQIIETGKPWDGKPYTEYVNDKYGDLPEWSDAIETDWESDLAGSAQGGRGRVVVVSTGKSDWERDHYVGAVRLIALINRTTNPSYLITSTNAYLLRPLPSRPILRQPFRTSHDGQRRYFPRSTPHL
jgi:hypothetical protein